MNIENNPVDLTRDDVVILQIALPRHACSNIPAKLHSGSRDGHADVFHLTPQNNGDLARALNELASRLAPVRPSQWQFNSAASRLITPQGCTVRLTAQECILLKILLARRGENIPRQIFFEAFNYPDTLSADLRLEGLISRLRGKVRKIDPQSPLPVQARYNLGYVFLADTDI